MKASRTLLLCLAGVTFLLFSGMPTSGGQLHWPTPKKEPIEVRLIALAIAYPRSSYFANDEVFIAEQELSKEESRFIKLVYDFLPYQPPLSSHGLDYSLVHKVHAVRDAACDETLAAMKALMAQQRQANEEPSDWKYALDCPIDDLDRRQARLRCYRTTADDYDKSLHQPTTETPY